jgi:hypothetical protein
LRGQARAGDEKNPRPKLIRNIFGGSLGGPVIKDRLFFFYSYEGRRDAAEQSILQTVPTETLRQGTVRYRNTAGGITTLAMADIARIFPATGGVNTVGLDILKTAPLPNSSELGDGLNIAGYRFNAPIKTKLGAHIGRRRICWLKCANAMCRLPARRRFCSSRISFPVWRVMRR